jgi:hypothetical protein
MALRPQILELKPGTRIVSNTFTMGDWQPDETANLTSDVGCPNYCTALFWIVPAKLAASYKTPHGELAFRQEFQMLSGSLTTSGRTLEVKGRVRGNEVSFSAGGVDYRARVNGPNLELQ